MYDIEEIQNRIYRDAPWDILFQDRVDRVKRAKELGKKVVGYLYPKFDSSTFRYRGYNICESLDYSFEWGGAFFQCDEIDRLEDCLDIFDVFVIIRCPWDEKLEKFIKSLKKDDVLVGYDVDDLVYHPKYYSELASALGLSEDYELNFWHGLMYRNMLITQMCNFLITTNDYLANYLKADFDIPCYVIPNYLNQLQEEVSSEYLNRKKNLKSENWFEIGYFSGSPTHAKDLQMAMPAIETFLNEKKNSRLKIVGYMELKNEYSYLVNDNRIVFESFKSMTGLQLEQAKVDVNIVPLINNTFSNCKSELKYFETAIVGTMTLATPTYAYSKAINDGINGYFCKDEEEWYRNLCRVYEKEQTAEDMKKLSEAALARYSNTVMTKYVEDILNLIIKEKYYD